ncbi:DUF3566 domain-containing protein [Streptomyces sp. Je 1-4]|uniref:DUF3566 domain-containing protein n=1 Tax=Streptomyces TaxID=1883 RepID=UPI00140EDAD0|nr:MULTISPECIES: DUF3566 domain-containing protein [unclassified Streptomyces]QIK07708.1 DUF3566 domain-containing protein [Streptomyces sp. ID38640]UYB41314.1 DUF3566 domain-containing protein [Streptomyces sp. Je 1-4]UZQ37500.1 DUF3566 domain-containing protein [Streptomyces sp. Je 1-4] [Streptomyces sp. Je 1-4 4N24]UZQ44917.1 DUF3566 domain-containing protein [Streptomyces sp. Je 1-4] [Streptomyces sp. Je 1-4 4N24_ara]
MSGATGAAAGGSGAGKGSSSGPATVTEDSARGSAVSDTGPRDEGSHQGGPVTDTRQPQPQPRPEPQAKAGSGAQQPYQPPQAYPTEDGETGGQAVRRPRTGATTAPRTRKARLRVARADPWSVMKVSFLLSIALGICTVVAVAVLWMVMNAMGVFSTVGATISEATGSSDGGGFDLQSFLSLPRALLFTSIIAVIDVVLATALATLGAFIYNLSAGFVGGVELTLAEDE